MQNKAEVNSNVNEELEELYRKGCSETESHAMETEEYLDIFSYKLGIPIDTFRRSEILESTVLKNILNDCKTIPQDKDVNGHASWHVTSMYSSLDSSLTINYPSLTRAQREEMVRCVQ